MSEPEERSGPTVSLAPDFFTIRVEEWESGVEGEEGFRRELVAFREYRSAELPDVVLYEEETARVRTA